MSFLDRVTSIFAPDDCLACGQEGSLLCLSCTAALPPVPGRCFGCNMPNPSVSCAECLDKSGLRSMQACVHYAGLAQSLVMRLKFTGNQSVARIIARCMNECKLPENSIITHMPATAAHIRQRGYDQSELIVRELLLPNSVHRARLLARTGARHQLGANRDKRLEQMKHALRVIRPDIVRGAHIVIVDDVLTTGASLRAAATALLGAGAVQVDAMVFAQASK